MAKLHKIEPIVKRVLENDPASRGDDFILILDVLSTFVTTEMSLEAVFKNHIALDIPSLESITRCRRKIQADNPLLRSKKADEIRQAAINSYIDYALGG